MERQHDMELPKLPGYSVHPPIAACYSKKQSLQYKNGYAVPVPISIQQETAKGTAAQQPVDHNWIMPSTSSSTSTNSCDGPFEPRYVQFDKKVLRYFGYFCEPVPDSPLEAWRARRVCVLLYLEDDTMQVTEPPVPNSGIMQGTLVRRHKIPSGTGGILGFADLAVGRSIRIYGRDVHIVDADAFSRDYSSLRGVKLAPALEYPVNPIDEALAAKSKPSGLSRSDPDSPSKFAEALLGHEHNSKSLQQFLQHGREVLRFFALWDDRNTPGGERHLFKLHYFVADSTAEVMEVNEPNSGRLGCPTFLKRGPLPKVPVSGGLPGHARLALEQCYGPQDLRIGATINVLARPFLLYDCDDATRKWYMDRLGFSPDMLKAMDISQPQKPLPVPQLPPHNGIGSPEDSMQNCLKLVPKPPKRDTYRWAHMDHIVLRYEAVLETAEGHGRLINPDRERRFVVSFYMADQTLSIFEPVQPNSGLQGGRFLERSKVYKPGSMLAWYTEDDMHINAVLELHGRRFRLVASDAFTEQYWASSGTQA